MPAKSAKKMSGEAYYPSQDVIAQARLKDWDALAASADKDLEGFWAKEAEELEWFSKWDKVLDDSKKPFFKWFVGGKVNIVHNAVDRHLKSYRKNVVNAPRQDGVQSRGLFYSEISTRFAETAGMARVV